MPQPPRRQRWCRPMPCADFLKANDVNASGTSMDAKASVVRVICVRK